MTDVTSKDIQQLVSAVQSLEKTLTAERNSSIQKTADERAFIAAFSAAFMALGELQPEVELIHRVKRASALAFEVFEQQEAREQTIRPLLLARKARTATHSAATTEPEQDVSTLSPGPRLRSRVKKGKPKRPRTFSGWLSRPFSREEAN